jgi:hypothetical protein
MIYAIYRTSLAWRCKYAYLSDAVGSHRKFLAARLELGHQIGRLHHVLPAAFSAKNSGGY